MVRTSFAEDIGRRPSGYAGDAVVNDQEESKVIDAVFAKWVPRSSRAPSKRQSQAPQTPPESMHPVVETARRENRRALLQTGDLTRSKGLAAKFKQYRLRDYFDSSGQRRYRNISMSFASRQSEDKDNDGTKRSRENIQTRDQTAREARLAAEMIQRDRNNIHDKNLQVYRELNEEEQELKSELLKRREDQLFIEIPLWQQCLPESINIKDLMCPLLSVEKERLERKQAERTNNDIMDDQKTSRQGWVMTTPQLKEVIKVLQLSRQAHGTEWSFGTDRSTFFRFLYDMGVIAEDLCPASFVGACFDEQSRPLRMTKMESWVGDDVLATAPMCMLVSQWGFAAALNSCLQRRYGLQNPDPEFFERLEDEARRLSMIIKAAAEGTGGAVQKKEDDESPSMNRDSPGSVQKRSSTSDSPGSPGRRRRGETEEDHGAKAIKLFCVRERWIACMLVEPEVQDIITHYKTLWIAFYKCYTGKYQEDTMSFEEFLQFARDWCLIPRLASTHVVLRAYRASECLERNKKPLFSTALAPKARQSTQQSTGMQQSTRPSQKMPPVNQRKSQKKAEDLPEAEKISEDLPEADEGNLDVTLKRPPKNYKVPLSIDLSASNEVPSKKGEPYTPASLTLRQGFGLACFTEAICRTTFHYLAINGNNIQQATSSRAKLLWLLTYLRNIFLTAKESLVKSPTKTRSEGMQKCLEIITEDMFSQMERGKDPVPKDSEEDDKQKLPALPDAETADDKQGRRSPDEYEMKQLKRIFGVCDTSGDGKIRKWELMKACRKHHDIAQFLRLPDKYSNDGPDSPADPSRSHREAFSARASVAGRSQEFTAHFQEFFDKVQEGGSGDATEDNELDFDEFKKFWQILVEADEAELPPDPGETPTPEPAAGPPPGKKGWHLRHLCNRGIANAAPVSMETLPGFSQPKPILEDLNSWYGRVGNSCVTPPPLNDFSRSIEKRLEDMILDKQRRGD